LESCGRNRKRAAELGIFALRNFSFPEGIVTLAAKSALMGVYETCRTIEPGINLDPVDLAYLHANRVYSRFGIRYLKDVIRENHEQRGWMILYTHDISPNPSPYGCTPEDFSEILECSMRSGADILPIGEATRRFRRLAELQPREV